MLFSRFAQSATALLLLTIGFVAPVHAQNNLQIISGTFYEDRATASVNSFGIVLTFAQTPTGKFLNVTNVSCVVSVTGQQILQYATLFAGTTRGANDLGRSYSIRGNVTPETGAGYKYYSIVTNQVFYKFGPGRFPSIEIDSVVVANGQTDASCTIVGNLTDN
jgi:hypothetical protein